MIQTDVLILGGLSGITAGISCRQHYPNKKVTLVRKEGTVLIPCGIPYIYGTVGGPQNNVIPDGLLQKNGIELIKGEAVMVNRDKKIVTLKDNQTIVYEKLVFATGSTPFIPPIPGVDKKNVYAVKKEFDYLSGLYEEMKTVKDLVIIGGGFIGVEFADECRKGRDINITVVEALPHCLQTAFDDEFCAEAELKLTEAGVKLLTDAKVETILGDTAVTGVQLCDGTLLKADMVILGIGAIPNTELAKKAGLRLGVKNAIKSKPLSAKPYRSGYICMWRLCRKTIILHRTYNWRYVGFSCYIRGAHYRSKFIFTGSSKYWCHKCFFYHDQWQGFRCNRFDRADGQAGRHRLCNWNRRSNGYPSRWDARFKFGKGEADVCQIYRRTPGWIHIRWKNSWRNGQLIKCSHYTPDDSK